MASAKRVTLKLSVEQKKQIKDATGKTAEQLDLSVEELEQRIAPMTVIVEKVGSD